MDNLQQKINKLKEYKGDPVLSVYLGEKSKKSPSSRYFQTGLKSLVKKNLSSDEKKFFVEDIGKIQKYLNEFYNARGTRSVIFFTSGKNLWEVFEFEFPLSDYCKVSKTPFLKPLLKALKDHEKYLVLLIDRKRARLFTVHLGIVEEQEDVFGEYVPQKVKQIHEAFKRENKILRHIEDHLNRHLKLITEKTKEFARNKHIRFLIIGGHEELLPEIKKLLPYPLSKKLRGDFITELNIPINDVYLKSKKIAERLNK